MTPVRRYVAAHNPDAESPDSRNPVWGVWDKQEQVWVEENIADTYWPAQIAANRWEQGREPENDEDRWATVETWLLTYYKEDYVRPYLPCIKEQGDWQYVASHADQFAGAQPGDGEDAFSEGMEFAISALLECHDGPHIASCPDSRT